MRLGGGDVSRAARLLSLLLSEDEEDKRESRVSLFLSLLSCESLQLGKLHNIRCTGKLQYGIYIPTSIFFLLYPARRWVVLVVNDSGHPLMILLLSPSRNPPMTPTLLCPARIATAWFHATLLFRAGNVKQCRVELKCKDCLCHRAARDQDLGSWWVAC